MFDSISRQIVFTLTARCRDCYRCLRACPVKAIRMERGQAYVDEKRCIACGTCIRECPQNAKSFRHDIDVAQRLIESGNPVVASIAPSFAAVFSKWQIARLASGLRTLGFRYIGQTSQGAYQVSIHSLGIIKKDGSKPYIGTACPAIVNYIEKYRPHLVEYLIPIVSPMIAHGRMLKERFGQDTKVIFIGPCVAKKSEILRPENKGVVDCVLTFKELMIWLNQKGVNFSNCEESNFDERPVHLAQLYPLPGGMIKTAGLDDDGFDLKLLRVDGINSVKPLLESIPEDTSYTLIEPLFCSQGCINGPGIDIEKNIFEKRKDLLRYDRETAHLHVIPAVEEERFFYGQYNREEGILKEVSEEEIERVFERTGKLDPQQQLNCGACGYDTCRDKAIAVVQGMAEPEMCIPYMKRLAERKTDQIFNTTPNGIVILDKELKILAVNPAFKKFFYCSDAVLGRHISYLMDPAPFEKLITGAADSIDIIMTHKNYNLMCRELLYILKQEQQIVGIFINITSQQENEKRLKEIKSQTVQQASELLEHQIKMAQTIARFLGESTARGEELVRKLMSLTETDEP
ncbi:MAG: 4Fe-4S binding protein [Syntrophorhabdaceae bacterium]|nr:4Fe-4S binding protein [Syntrophorhabdaceae bacterium]